MKALHGAGLESLLINTLAKELDVKGTLHVLRHGFKFYGKTFRLAYFKPAHGLNDEVLELYAQEPPDRHPPGAVPSRQNDTVDMVFAVNGLPVATCELKNPGTGQTWRHAVRQYQEDRDPRAPLFRFKKRALVHFAADPDEVHMTTRLAGDETHFLPFNRGSHPGEVQCGAGNPQHPSGYRTGYFWEEVLQRDSFLDILGHFMFIEKKEEKVDDGHGRQRRVTRETMIFPRYHQLDAVRKIVAAARGEGAGPQLPDPALGRQRQDQQHLLALAPAGQPARRRTTRRSSTASSSSPTAGCSTSSCRMRSTRSSTRRAWSRRSTRTRKQLAAALIDGTKIVITTLQKFPFVLRGLLHAAGRGEPGAGDRRGEAAGEGVGGGDRRAGSTRSSWTRRTPARPARRRGS